MPIIITKPSSQIGSTSNVAVFSMAPTFTPSAYSTLVVFANASGTLTGLVSGITNLLVASHNPQAMGNSTRLWLTDIISPPSPMNINLDYGADPATGCAAVALQMIGHAVGWPPAQTVNVSSIGNNPVVTFNSAVTLGSAAIVAISMNGAMGKVTPPAGWTTIATSYGTPTTGLVVAYNNSVSGTTFTFSTGAVTGLSYIALEYYAAPEPCDPVGMSGMFGV